MAQALRIVRNVARLKRCLRLSKTSVTILGAVFPEILNAIILCQRSSGKGLLQTIPLTRLTHCERNETISSVRRPYIMTRLLCGILNTEMFACFSFCLLWGHLSDQAIILKCDIGRSGFLRVLEYGTPVYFNLYTVKKCIIKPFECCASNGRVIVSSICRVVYC